MEQVIYTSIAVPGLDAGELFRIVSRAATKNVAREITGMLVVVDGRFFQAIEGPAASIEALMAELHADKRHHSLRVLRRRTIAGRQFDDWSMQRFRIRDVSTARRVFRELMASSENASDVLRRFGAYVVSNPGVAA